jgi:glutathione S-transferase
MSRSPKRQKSSPKVTLGYWAIRGLAQPIRLLLNYIGVEFNDHRYVQGDAPGYSRAEWESVKFTLGLDFPNLPYIIDEESGIKLSQSNAVLNFVARKWKPELLGTTLEKQSHVDMLVHEAYDFRNKLVGIFYSPDCDKKKAGFVADVLTPNAQKLSNYLGDKDWFVGELTVVDFLFYELLDQARLFSPGTLEHHENLKNFFERFEALSAIKRYMASPDFIKRPINAKMASFK